LNAGMSIAGPADQSAAPAAQGPSVNRRTVLGAALAAGAGAAALRTVVYPRLEELVRGGSAAGRGDWISPLGGEKAHEARIAHLLRRTAFGATLDDLELAAYDG